MEYQAQKYERIVSVLVTINLILSIIAAIAIFIIYSSHDMPIALGGAVSLLITGLFIWAVGKLLVNISVTAHENQMKIQAAINIELRNK